MKAAKQKAVGLKVLPSPPQETPSNVIPVAFTQNLTWLELLGRTDAANEIPRGYYHPQSIELTQGTSCYVFKVRSRVWLKGTYKDYSDKGLFARVQTREGLLNVFGVEQLAVRGEI